MAAKQPLVTFALLAYNQERFIREAVEGALSQTYSPLEIILSDDHSSDRTFDLMEEIASNYLGPHKIILNRNAKNLGLANHYNNLIKIAKGDYITSAAGDDISDSSRVTKLMETVIKNHDCHCAHSNAFQIGPDGERLGLLHSENITSAHSHESPPWEFTPNSIGCSQIWKRQLHDVFGPFHNELIIEDQVIAFRANLVGSIHYLNAPLVFHRIGNPSLSGKISELNYGARMNIICNKIRAFIITCEQLLKDLETARLRGMIKEDNYLILKRKITSKTANHHTALASILLRSSYQSYSIRNSLKYSFQMITLSAYSIYYGLRVDIGRLLHIYRSGKPKE